MLLRGAFQIPQTVLGLLPNSNLRLKIVLNKPGLDFRSWGDDPASIQCSGSTQIGILVSATATLENLRIYGCSVSGLGLLA